MIPYVCPLCSEALVPNGDELRCSSHSWPVRAEIPRFVPDEGYAENFAIQWSRFRETQLDSFTGLELYRRRFREATRWQDSDLRGRTLLEVGAGAGAFTEVLATTGARVVSVDLSTAIDANRRTNGARGVQFAQADVYALPFESASFDFVFCFGVLQHTPEPEAAYRALWSMVKPGGKLSIDWYAKLPFPNPWYHPKYFWRPITTRIDPQRLLRIIEWYVPKWLPIDTRIRRIPRVGQRLAALTMIPCWNHFETGLTGDPLTEWAVMNTFDALGAKYDCPKTLEEVESLVAAPDVESAEVFRGSNGIVANVRKTTLRTE